MAIRKPVSVVNDGGSKRTTKPVGSVVGNVIPAAGSVVGSPGKGVADMASRAGAVTIAKSQLAGVPKTVTQTDSSARDAYLAKLKAQLEAQTAAYDQLLAYNQQMYDEQKKQAAQDREDNARRAYIAKEMALKNMPGQLAREGINGGLAETSYVKLNNRYARSLAEGDSDYSDAVSRAYLDMVKANREPQTGKMNAQASYTAGVAKAPSSKTIKVANKAYIEKLQDSYNRLRKAGYSDVDAARLLGIE